ncbi:MAG TPA: hypothetical protein VGM50_18050 [Gemmatimonadaceae bacterium]
MRSIVGLIVLAASAACSISTDASRSPSSPPAPPTNPSSGVLLKNIEISTLPSPFYHFDYDATGQISGASFASSLSTYTVSYANGRLDAMRNSGPINSNRLVYSYDNLGRCTAVRYLDSIGNAVAIVFLGYNGQQLTTLERDRLVTGGGVVEKTMSFTYGADGNLTDVTERHPAVAGERDESTVTDHYEDYDRGINVDGFSLLHSEFFDDLVLLPQVQLQKGNPRTVTHTGDGENFRVQYGYVYDAQNRPLARNGVITLTSGPNVGQQIPSTTTFSYY